MKIILIDVVEYTMSMRMLINILLKKMKFELNGNLKDKFYDIFEDIKEKLNIAHINYVYESPINGVKYLQTAVSDKTLFENDNDSCIISSKKNKY